jgi:hypothetical protein
VRVFSLSIITVKIVLVVPSCKIPNPHFLGWLSLSAVSPMVGADVNPNCHFVISNKDLPFSSLYHHFLTFAPSDNLT